MIQKYIIKYLLNPLTRIVNILDNRQKNVLFILSGVLLFIRYFIHGTGQLSGAYIIQYALGCLCMGVMMLMALQEDIKEVSFNPILISCWMIVGGGILFAAIRFNTDWLSEAIIYLIICPIAFIIWGNLNYEIFLKQLIKIVMISFLIYLGISLIFYPIGDKQYGGLFANVNGTSQYLDLVFACLLVRTLAEKNKVTRIIWMLGLGVCFALIFYTNSRTGQLAAALSLIVTLFIYLVQDLNKWKSNIVCVILPIAFVLALSIPTTVHLVKLGNSVGTIIRESIEINKGHIATNESDISVDSFIELNKQKNDLQEKSADTYSTGRISIWKAYLENTEMFGSGKEEKFWIESRDQYYTTAHMTPITYAFRYGWVCAIIYLVYNILAGIEAIRFGLKTKNAYTLLPIAITIAYGITSVLASINTPFNYMITMYYYFVQTVLVLKIQLPIDAKTK